MKCWSCEEAVEGPLCAACGKIQPPAGRETQDLFAILGVPRAYALDPEALEARYRELQRALHPDRFARATPRERMYSVQQTTAVNEAYRTLRDPIRRAEYLLSLAGVDLSGERPAGGSEKVPPELLAEVMELREALLEAKAEGDQGKVEAMRRDVAARREADVSAVAETFARAGGGVPGGAAAQEIGRHLVALRYWRRFLDEAEGRAAEV